MKEIKERNDVIKVGREMDMNVNELISRSLYLISLDAFRAKLTRKQSHKFLFKFLRVSIEELVRIVGE